MWIVVYVIDGQEIVRRFLTINQASDHMDHVANTYPNVLFEVMFRKGK